MECVGQCHPSILFVSWFLVFNVFQDVSSMLGMILAGLIDKHVDGGEMTSLEVALLEHSH